jgi:hypothetical protein
MRKEGGEKVKKVNNEVGEKGKNKKSFLLSFFFLLLLLFLSLQVVACAGEITKPNASRLYRLQSQQKASLLFNPGSSV